jgi:DNA polymerase-3 subunit gamma/tau
MSYQVLARKWRPRVFREMVGQGHVLQALINALDTDRLHHAYLFTGTRGVGKTTVARILAKCLNCETGVSSEPCGKCGSCLEIAEGRSIDLIEVDAASRTKVEDTRELLENVQYAPTSSRYKVYLIDEVHMLSTSSFNALLKTLEEPPPHVKFLLATTDPQKLPATVLSRCLQFNLKNMPPDLIVSYLGQVLADEKITAEEPALWLLGRAADGSMRDALSLTDQAIAFGAGQLLEADVRVMLGTVELNFVYELLQAVAGQDAGEVLQIVERMAEHVTDFEGALQELASLLHRVAIAQAVPEAADNRWGDATQVRSLASSITAEDAQLYYQLALTGKRDIGLAPDLRAGIEMTLLRMIAFRPAAVIGDTTEELQLEPVVAEAAAPAKKPERTSPAAPVAVASAPVAATPAASPEMPLAPVVPVVEAQQAEPNIPPGEKPVPAAEAAVAASFPETAGAGSETTAGAGSSTTTPIVPFEPGRWAELLEQLGLSGILYNVASHCELRRVDGDKAYLVLDESNGSLYSENHCERIADAINLKLGREVSVFIEVGVPEYETPAAKLQRLLDERLAKAVSSIEADPRVQLLIDQFEGELDRGSIAPIKH